MTEMSARVPPDDATRSLFLRGHCDAMAVALHRITGLPIVLIGKEYVDTDADGETCFEPCHLGVSPSIPSATVLDASGLGRLDDLAASLCFSTAQPGRIIMRPISERECRETFTVEEIPETLITEATAFAMRNLLPCLSPP
jgi:hypothetical protein